VQVAFSLGLCLRMDDLRVCFVTLNPSCFFLPQDGLDFLLTEVQDLLHVNLLFLGFGLDLKESGEQI
jgi:hypothetical protein